MKKIKLNSGEIKIVTDRFAENEIYAKRAKLYEEPKERKEEAKIEQKEDKTLIETKEDKVATWKISRGLESKVPGRLKKKR